MLQSTPSSGNVKPTQKRELQGASPGLLLIYEPPELSTSYEKSPRLDTTTSALNETPKQLHTKFQSPSPRLKNLSHIFESPTSDASETSIAASGKEGKAERTSRVIEVLGSKLDWSKREISWLKARLEEEEQRSEGAKSALESARASATQYENLYDQAQTTIGRKDRKLDEIKAELESERSRRIQAEKDRDGTFDQVTTTIAQYEALKGIMRSQEHSFRKQLTEVRQGLDDLGQQRQTDFHNIQRLELISKDLSRQQKAVDQAYQAHVAKFELYKIEKESSLKGIANKAKEMQEAGDQFAMDMEETLGRMKYIVNVKETLQD